MPSSFCNGTVKLSSRERECALNIVSLSPTGGLSDAENFSTFCCIAGMTAGMFRCSIRGGDRGGEFNCSVMGEWANYYSMIASCVAGWGVVFVPDALPSMLALSSLASEVSGVGFTPVRNRTSYLGNCVKQKRNDEREFLYWIFFYLTRGFLHGFGLRLNH